MQGIERHGVRGIIARKRAEAAKRERERMHTLARDLNNSLMPLVQAGPEVLDSIRSLHDAVVDADPPGSQLTQQIISSESGS